MKCKNCSTEFEGNVCPNCGITQKPDIKTIIDNNKELIEKVKSFLIKKWWIVLIVIVLLIIIFGGNEEKREKVEWSSLELGQYIPESKKGELYVWSNSDDYLSVKFENVTNDYYNEYKNACIEMGYTVESEKNGNNYDAFNNEGYDLSISYISKDIHITLKAPIKMSEFEWPTKGIGAMLPKTMSTLGKVTSDSSNCFRVTVGDTTIDDFNDYIDECDDNGFNIDYMKQEKSYFAKNSEGYRLNLTYLGANMIELLIEAPEEEKSVIEENKEDSKVEDKTEVEEDKESSKEETTNKSEKPEITKPSKEESTTKKENNSTGLSKNFKDAMDSYEEFMMEYCDFMEKYSKSGGGDLSLIADYAKYMTKYAEVCKDFEKWEDEEMNVEEAAYYLDVQTRVTKKLLEVAQ